jgi:cytochrome P450
LAKNKRLEDALDLFDKYCWEIMAEAKKKVENRDQNNAEPLSLMELMFAAGAPEKSIRDNVGVFFLAGHETTAATLGWILSILGTNSEVQDKARKEVYEKVPNEITYDSLKELNYIEGLIKESLRLYPGVPSLGGRKVEKDITLGDIRIPANTGVQVDLTTMGYDPKIWGDPKEVRPERWFSENLTKEQRIAWMPFSYGPRTCIGMNFSLLEQKIFLVKLLKTFKDIKLAPNAVIETKVGSIIYSPNPDKLKIIFSC